MSDERGGGFARSVCFENEDRGISKKGFFIGKKGYFSEICGGIGCKKFAVDSRDGQS